MQLKGSFEAASLASILQMLHNDAKTGELKLSSGDREVVIFLSNGSVIFARGNQQGMRVGSLLRSKGIISAAQLQQCLALARKNSTTLGSVLVSENIISHDMLNKVLAKQAQAAIHNVFLWQSGTFEYNDRTSPPEGILESPIDIMGIILEATRRIDEMSVLTKHIETDRVVFRISERFSERDRLKFNAIEWRFLSLIDGTRTVRQLIDESGYEDFAVYKVLNSLLSFGLIDRAPDPEPEDDRAQARFAVAALFHELIMETARAAQAELACRPYAVRWPRGAKPINVDKKNLKSMREESARHQIAMIIAGSIPPITPSHMDIFAGFCLATPQDVFGHAAMEILKDSTNSEAGFNFLLESLNCFMGRILESLSKRLTPASFARILRDMRRTVMLLDRYLKGLPEKDSLLQGITSRIDDEIRSIGKINRPLPGSVCICLVVAPDRRNRDACRLLPPEAAPRADMKPLEAPAPPQAQVVEVLPAEEQAAVATAPKETPLQEEPAAPELSCVALDEDIPPLADQNDLTDLADDLEQIPDLADLEEMDVVPEYPPAKPKAKAAEPASEKKSMAQVLEERYGLLSQQDEPKGAGKRQKTADIAHEQDAKSFSGIGDTGKANSFAQKARPDESEFVPEISALNQIDELGELDDIPDLADLEEMDSIPDLAGMEEIGPVPEALEDNPPQGKGGSARDGEGFFGLSASGTQDIEQPPDMEDAIDSDSSLGSLGGLDGADDNLEDALGSALDELGELDSALDRMEDLSEDDVIGGKKPEEEQKAQPSAARPKVEPRAVELDQKAQPPASRQNAAQAARQALEFARKALADDFGSKPQKPGKPLEAQPAPSQPKAAQANQPSMPRARSFNEMEEELLDLLDEEPIPEDLSNLVMENPSLQNEKTAPPPPKKTAPDF
ncbi:MAG: DUF4388 domain-containing protein, partial [Desulfatibacillaceae bacterium]|nr:DUF4388 domain-containing protein [Desulfatibacillaceae bacterium]